MCVLSESNVVGPVTDEPSESGADGVSLRCRSLPFVVDEFRGIEPRTLLRLEADIGPGLMGVPGQQQAIANAESRVMLRERIRCQISRLPPQV